MRSVMRPDASLLALALDVSVPPLALLALQLAVVWVASLVLFAQRPRPHFRSQPRLLARCCW